MIDMPIFIWIINRRVSPSPSPSLLIRLVLGLSMKALHEQPHHKTLHKGYVQVSASSCSLHVFHFLFRFFFFIQLKVMLSWKWLSNIWIYPLIQNFNNNGKKNSFIYVFVECNCVVLEKKSDDHYFTLQSTVIAIDRIVACVEH